MEHFDYFLNNLLLVVILIVCEVLTRSVLHKLFEDRGWSRGRSY